VEQGHSHREAAQITRIDPSTLTRARQRYSISPKATCGQIDLEAVIRSTKKARDATLVKVIFVGGIYV